MLIIVIMQFNSLDSTIVESEESNDKNSKPPVIFGVVLVVIVTGFVTSMAINLILVAQRRNKTRLVRS